MTLAPFTFRASRWKAAAGVIFIAGWAAVLGWHSKLPFQEANERLNPFYLINSAFEAFQLLVLAGGFILCCDLLFSRHDDIVVNPAGLMFRGHSDELIPWSAIERAWASDDRRTLLFKLREPDRYPPSGWRRWISWGRTPKDADVAITLPLAPARFEQLVEAIDKFGPDWIRGL